MFYLYFVALLAGVTFYVMNFTKFHKTVCTEMKAFEACRVFLQKISARRMRTLIGVKCALKACNKHIYI